MRHARTATFYLDPEYVADQLKWSPVSHPLVHCLHRARDGDPKLQPLQLPVRSLRKLTPMLARLTHLNTEDRDFARLSMAFEIFDAVGRLSGTNIDNLDVARILPRREVTKAITLLRSDLAREWKIEDLARDVALSPSHLTRLFSLQFGVAPGSFLRQLRADRMAELLATTSLTVGETGAAVGWHDLSMASRSFKQRYGVAPSVYARLHRSRRHSLTEAPLLPR